MKSRYPLMVCTHSRGGMRSVVETYERSGLCARWGFKFLWPHKEGSFLTRAVVAIVRYVELVWLLSLGRVSFMHVHAAMRGSFWRKSLFAATARIFGVPTVMHLHGSEMETFYASLPMLLQRMVRRSLENAAAIVVLSESWRKFVERIAPDARITVISNYVALPPQPYSDAIFGQYKVLFLGLLGRRKGIFDLLEVWPQVVASVPNARLQIGGNGEINLAKERAASLGILGSVDFLGWVDGEQKLALLKDADAFVLPSYNEGLPMGVLEAMSWGKAVVTTRVGGIPELVTDGVDGLLIEAGDQIALATAVIRLGTDPEYRQSIGLKGRKRIESSYSESAILPRLEAIYADLSNRFVA